MVKHNNVVPNAHFHKKWQTRVKTWFDQPAKKKSRRLKRAAKAAAMAPRPASGPLRPAVHCPTIRYNRKVKAGRGFTLKELKLAGVDAKTAPTIGIAVDHRRRNKSEQSVSDNVERIKAYMDSLVVFKRGQKVKAGDSDPSEYGTAVQVSNPFPVVQATPVAELADIAEAKAGLGAYKTIRIERTNQRMAGLREKRRLEAEEAKK
mmetsp:Transcript_66130/g.142770  ORF Transcript_66130/g.142770 Transcript_66130/m.142770 type:complete len:205 (+) Transcript_66130:20-634(+)|eukprot:CAMPEP_0116915690 /NCGR_PEP_ID=MMETSP0467-20121206/18078_1 /TAXON_ID=283647 /ORGANISM="Mesodinium pulex, Strain SPMC105" /LENGTH=204 /DNA_ID=CAMNT_0004592401 /DNA_START=20 /DNA_END=634 /DNA_ORIENTATION=-